ncbi:hypothetical protein C7B80_24915 [Cyanosarcina cf. burmensis CCALA 770]|nr:hypothetical protein C7B80_24915 [Cyanosarcina cf. burmensis CCALA 770]
MTKRILILSSNPKGTSALDLDIEKREIREALKGFKFNIETRGAVRPKDLQQALVEVKPQIVHFCGHGEGSQGIVLVNDAGEIALVDTQALADLFKIFSARIECIVLNACYSEVQANAIVEHINYVVGMNRSVFDEAAILFARGFYAALGAGESIQTAYEIGKNAIQLEFPDNAAIRRKLNPILDDKDFVLPDPEYLVPILRQKENPLEIQLPEVEPNFDKDSVKSLIGHSEWIRAIAFSPDGKYLISGSNDRTVRLWDLQTGQLIRLLKGHKERVKYLRVSEDGNLIISGSADSTLKIWEIETGNCIRTIKTSQNPQTVLNAIAINASQHTIATGSTSVQGTVKLWNWQTGEMIDAVRAASSGIRSLAMSQDGKILVSGSGGGTIKIWHLDRGLNQPKHDLSNAHMSDVLTLAIRNQILISGGEDRTIKIWDLNTTEKQQPIHILEGHGGSIWCVVVSPDGTKIASASADYTVKIWDLLTGQILETLTGHLGEVRTVTFSPDSKMLASAGDDWVIKLWQL